MTVAHEVVITGKVIMVARADMDMAMVIMKDVDMKAGDMKGMAVGMVIDTGAMAGKKMLKL